MNTVAENTKAIIDRRGYKHKAIAEKAGYSVQQFSGMLNGRKLITWKDVLHISNALGVTPNDLYGITSEEEQKEGE